MKVVLTVFMFLGLLFMGCLKRQDKIAKPDALSLMSGKGECLVCHSLDGKKKWPLVLKDYIKSKPQWILADEEYLRRSILSPEA